MAFQAPHSLLYIMICARGPLSNGQPSSQPASAALACPAFGIMACWLPLCLKSHGSGVHARVTCSPSHLCTHSLCCASRQDTGCPSMTWVMGGHEAPCLASMVPGDNPQKTTVRNQDRSQSLAAQVYPGTDYMFSIIIKSKYPYYRPCAGILFSVDGNPAVLHQL